jgi:hypothetical protein
MPDPGPCHGILSLYKGDRNIKRPGQIDKRQTPQAHGRKTRRYPNHPPATHPAIHGGVHQTLPENPLEKALRPYIAGTERCGGKPLHGRLTLNSGKIRYTKGF